MRQNVPSLKYPETAQRGSAMGTIILRCPITGREYASGIEIDEASFLRLPDIKMKSRCPHCGTDHTWSLRDARLSPEKLAGVASVVERGPHLD